ncbi:MAG: DivIVA domain-containing protein, partial [Firmicutes bacterium]|nr:DivIVA domain-containing protein [Bacillota bacterium]
MVLTPMEIHNKEFSKGFRGYNEDQVDQFLDKIVEEFEKLYKENIELKEKVAASGDQISQYKTIENTLKETLITAQRTADEVTATAQKKSELILEAADQQARRIVESANGNVLEIQKEYQDTKKQVQIFKSRFKSLLETQMELIIG